MAGLGSLANLEFGNYPNFESERPDPEFVIGVKLPIVWFHIGFSVYFYMYAADFSKNT